MSILEVLPRFEVAIFVVLAAVTMHLWILLRREQEMMRKIRKKNEALHSVVTKLQGIVNRQNRDLEEKNQTIAELRNVVNQPTEKTGNQKIEELREQIWSTHKKGRFEAAVVAALAVVEVAIRFWQ